MDLTPDTFVCLVMRALVNVAQGMKSSRLIGLGCCSGRKCVTWAPSLERYQVAIRIIGNEAYSPFFVVHTIVVKCRDTRTYGLPHEG